MLSPMERRIAEAQEKGRRSQYSPVDLERAEYYRKIFAEKEKFKNLLLTLLEEDRGFREEVRKLLMQ